MSRAPSISIQGSWLPWSSQADDQKSAGQSKGTSPVPSGPSSEANTVDGAVATPPEGNTNSVNNVGAFRRESMTFASLSSNTWLGSWNKSRSGSDAVFGKMDDKDKEGGSEEAIYDEEDNDNGTVDEEYEDPDKGNVIDDHVTSKKSSWGFWNGGNAASTTTVNNENDNGNGNNNNNSNKAPSKKESFTNTIIPSNHSITSNPKKEATNADDDAVLYKPHTDAKEFQEINTHKNENLKENVIVPNWDSCLPFQSQASSNASNIANSLFGSSSTSNNNTSNLNLNSNKLDLKNWRHFLSQLSSKLGFSSQSLTSVVEDTSSSENDPAAGKTGEDSIVEKELNLLYEKTYKLYGRSLSKLPEHKKACLPNYNKYYTEDDQTREESTAHKSSSEHDDQNDDDDISISNDPMGNLLINHGKPSRNTSTSVHATKSGPLVKIKKILIIGVHGFFPTKMVRPFIGSPKGTSLKFANEAEKGIIRYCIENNLISSTESNVSIQKIALEMEGKIFDRVGFFTKIMKKWSAELNDADFIFFASHSQGCVVSIILLARLMTLGILKDPTRKRIGVLGMAGINNGPFYGIDKSLFMKAYSAIENESMSELFELNKFTSKQSLAYKESIQIIINANVKICFIGSVNDQLVPLYSAFASHVFHPNIYRACYIDHASQTSSFIQKLVSLCCQLQNLGFFDNNVIKELSTILAGPLTGSGHSKIYNDGKVYDLGIKFVLDTDDIVIPPPKAFDTEARETMEATSSLIGSYDGVQSHPVKSLQQNGEDDGGLVTSGLGTYGPVIEEDEKKLILPITNQIYIKEYNVGKIGTNPFILPWCFRGLLFNIEKNWPNNNKLLSVQAGSDMGKNGYDEINELYELFENWKPETKLYKDLKYRLNGIRASKL
ncbi:uncharacterized protein CLIB1423_36S00386 [[Candida] railenensis]|uniref:YMC020W-like alpha/beta hydrolase domain-containing protein n=1 Tax=[Candida] railenensis TaxID=45579 RepID=A0A9P0QUF8_9ASCO|nr:uncharacterized protein CLIB1423_36S00386 [[Candida] railenensis]